MRFPAQKLLLVLAMSVALVACASIQPPEPPSLELPKAASDLRAARKGDKVTLTWTVPSKTTDRQSVRYLGKTRVCRSLDLTFVKCGVPVGEVPPPPDFAAKEAAGQKLAASYTGTVSARLHLDGKQLSLFSTVTYAVEVLNEDGRSAGLSNQVRVSLAEALPPPKDFAAQLTGHGVVLTWAGVPLSLPLPDPIRRSYRVYRRVEGSQQKVLVGEEAAGSEIHFSLTDQSFEWEKTYYYHADTLTLIAQTGKPDVSIEGDDTPEVKVFADDVFPPAVPSGLQAVFAGPGGVYRSDLVSGYGCGSGRLQRLST